MASRLTLVRKDGQPVQIPEGDALLLRGALYGPNIMSAVSGDYPDLAAAKSNNVTITGAVQIIGFELGGTQTPSGTEWRVTFEQSLRIVHNYANDRHVLNLGQADVITQPGDVAVFQKTGTGNEAKMVSYTRLDGTALTGSSFRGGTMTSAINEAPITRLYAQNPSDLGATTSNVVNLVYFNSTVTSFGTSPIGFRRTVIRTGSDQPDGVTGAGDTGPITLVHSSALRLPGAANIVMVIGDSAEFESLGSGNWFCTYYKKADGTAVVSSGSGGASTYTWTQDTATAVWTIPHNLNRRPSVTVVDTLDNVIVPDVSYVDSNTVQVTHGAAYAGKAYLN
jgi:hypothetical protein